MLGKSGKQKKLSYVEMPKIPVMKGTSQGPHNWNINLPLEEAIVHTLHQQMTSHKTWGQEQDV